MNWDAISAIAEMLGALAVVLTLIYLSFQLRENTKSVIAANHSTWINAASASNAYVSNIASYLDEAFNKTRELTQEERSNFESFLFQVFNTFEGLYVMHMHDSVDASLYEAKMRQAVKLLELPGVQEFWEENKFSYDDRFVAMLDQEAT